MNKVEKQYEWYSLPFVGKNAFNKWHVKPDKSNSWGEAHQKDMDTGSSYAKEYLRYLNTTSDSHPLELDCIISAMFQRGKPELRAKERWIRLGFLRAITEHLSKQRKRGPLDRFIDAYRNLSEVNKVLAHRLIENFKDHTEAEATSTFITSGNVVTVDFKGKPEDSPTRTA